MCVLDKTHLPDFGPTRTPHPPLSFCGAQFCSVRMKTKGPWQVRHPSGKGDLQDLHTDMEVINMHVPN